MSEENPYLESFSKLGLTVCMAFIKVVANGFEKTNDLHLLEDKIHNQVYLLGLSNSQVDHYLAKKDIITDLPTNLRHFTQFQKRLLVNLCSEILKYNNEVSEHNFLIAENCFEKLANIYPEEFAELLAINHVLHNKMINLVSRKQKELAYFKKIAKEDPDLVATHFGTLMQNKESNKNCYIATLAYGDINHPKVQEFRNIRDNHLSKNIFGQKFIKIYYQYSPYLVTKLQPYKQLNTYIKNCLDLLLFLNKIK